MSDIVTGQLITLSYESREFDVVVIDPNGLGEGQPSVGFGFRMAERYAGIPQSTLTDWVTGPEGDHSLQLPSGKLFRVTEIQASDGNTYSVVEASDWFAVAVDLLVVAACNKDRQDLQTRKFWARIKCE